MKKIKFEDALKRLDEIVQELEKGNLPLEKSIKLYEEGKGLAQFCSKELEGIEKRIEILKKDEEGRMRKEPFELPGEEKEEEGEEGEEGEKGEGLLF